MRKILAILIIITAVGTCLASVPATMSYQGKLTNSSGQPVSDGAYQVTFKFYFVETGGSPTWTSSTISVNTSGGIFTTSIASIPASVFSSSNVWLETVWGGETLAPRVKFTSVPYAFRAGEASDAWKLTGNSGTDPATNFLGTTDNQALEFKANNSRVLRLEPNAVSPNIIGGHSTNSVNSGVAGATISGGGDSTNANVVTDDYGTIGGGRKNRAGDNAGTASDRPYTTVAGGYNNVASGFASVVGGGEANKAEGWTSGVLGGELNTAGGNYSVLGGGGRNSAGGYISTLGGGVDNQASGDYSFVGGGGGNIAGGYGGAVGGGGYNTADGLFSTVPGGVYNSANGDYSFAAGRLAKAIHTGAFVWGDSTDANFTSTALNQFLIRAGGGVGINTNAPTGALSVAGNADFSGNVGIGTASPTNRLSVAGDGDVSGKLQVGASAPWYTNRLDVVGGDNWDLTNTEGDFRIGNDDYRLKMGVALGGWGAGVAGIRASGGVNLLVLGAGTADKVFVGESGVGIGTASPQQTLSVSGGLNVDQSDANNGLANPGITFGSGSGEGIASKRTAGGNQYGLDFYTTWTNRMSLSNAGYLGIGTTTPAARLDVRGGNADIWSTEGDLRIGNDTYRLKMGVDTSSFGGGTARIQAMGGVSSSLQIGAGGSPSIYIFEDKIGIGAFPNNNILSVIQNSSTDPIADAWTVYSSGRWKTNIEPIAGALDKVQKLRGVSFNWKDGGKHDIGLIAEEVGKVIPEVVAYEENGEDARSVDYARLVAVLIEGMKEQQKTIDELMARNAQIDEIKAELAVLKAQQQR